MLLQALDDAPGARLHVLAEPLHVTAAGTHRFAALFPPLRGLLEDLAALRRYLVTVLLHACMALRAGADPRAEPLHVGLARHHAFAELRDPAAAVFRYLVLVLLQAGGDAALARLDARTEPLRVIHAWMLHCLREQEREQDRHGSLLASERIASVIDGSCGTETISRLSASPMPGTCAPASSLGGAASS